MNSALHLLTITMLQREINKLSHSAESFSVDVNACQACFTGTFILSYIIRRPTQGARDVSWKEAIQIYINKLLYLNTDTS